MPNRSPLFAGRTVVITGGAGGIGIATGLGFAGEGAAVAVIDSNAEAVDAAVVRLRAAGAEAIGLVVDVRDVGSVSTAMATVVEALDGLDVLVTLAGGSLGTPPDLGSITPDDLALVLDVNVRGTFLCAQAALAHMHAGGAVVTVSSIGARQPSPVTGVPYAAAKAAVLGMTRKLAKEVGGRGIRVNAVAPGLFLTDRLQLRFDAMSEFERREVLDAIPLGRMPELREVVEPILFLASDQAGYITGVVLDINGGRYMPQ